jgi:predicted secreted protein
MMVLQEAAIRARVTTQLTTLARPTCMILPAALTHGTVASSGCISNRIYTDLSDAELYVAVPGRDLTHIAAETAVVTAANVTLLAYRQARKRELVLG